MPMVVGVVAGVAVAAVLVLTGLFKMMWRVAEPNEALVISGSKHRTEGLEEGMGFRIVSEQQLQADVRKPADAQAYEKRTLAEAERDARISAAEARAKETELAAAAEATRVKAAAGAEAEATKTRGAATASATRATGEAEAAAAQARGLANAEATKAKGLAEAEAIKARAAALAENQEAVVAQQLAENWPEIVQAGASAFGNVDNIVVLNGADGMADMFAKALTMGGTGLGLARRLLASMNRDGQAPEGDSPLNGLVQKVPMDEK
ncbi:flotillin domain-containing protein [Streptomyces chartreusis]|uniref:flotillin domain-containing protein n=1 Tax=Streptomyces chartreusis TaxID=1969 RepID=UPI00362AE10F